MNPDPTETSTTNPLEPGQKVRLLFDVFNDGTLYGKERGELLQRQGDLGYVKQKGWFLEDEVYDVHFLETDRIIGCRAKELIGAQEDWSPPLFAKGEAVRIAMKLTHRGQTLAEGGESARILKVRYRRKLGYHYLVGLKEGGSILLLQEQLEKT